MHARDAVLLDRAEAARRLCCSVTTIKRLVAAGKLRPVYLTGKRSPRIHVDELRRFADDAYAALPARPAPNPEPEEVEGGDEGPLVTNVDGQVVRLAPFRPPAAGRSGRRKKRTAAL